MKKRILFSLFYTILLLNLTLQAQEIVKPVLDWDALNHPVPEWFLDAKLGIYFHWGVYSVPAFGSEWYPRNMYRKESPEYKHHIEKYGNPSDFGYHDFVPMFKAEHFNADEWAELFKKSGAKFAGPVAEHHDGFSMWASKVNPWNAKDRGPKRDIVAEMEKAVRKQGMRFITSFHHAFNNQYAIKDFPNGFYPKVEGWPTASNDKELRLLYGNLPRNEFLEIWKKKLFEVIDGYRPDIIWFDFVLGDIPEESRKEFLTYYFNAAARWHKEVLVTRKQDDLPNEVSVEDFEKGRLDHLTDYPWLTDDTISWGSWCYTDGLDIKSTQTVLHTLIDIVSKNGVLLLNISPRSDGTIPEEQQQVLLDMGQWFNVNGEAIYETRPWLAYGEGPTNMGQSGHFVGRIDYQPNDFRFTKSKDGQYVYLITLGWPGTEVIVESFQVNNSTNARVELLGYNGEIEFTINPRNQIQMNLETIDTEQVNSKHAFVFKLSDFDLSLHADASFASPNAIRLLPDNATLEGSQRIQGEGKFRNIGYWDNYKHRVHWLVRIASPGSYKMRGKFSAGNDTSKLKISLNEDNYIIEIAKTKDWNAVKTIPIGHFSFTEAGVYHVILHPTNKEEWNALNVFGIELSKDDTAINLDKHLKF